jgi:shikimate dehydrogenase
MKRYAVFGHPVTHSLSPFIHAEFGTQLGMAVDYRAIDATAERFAAALAEFAEEGGVGANVTLPLKEIAYGLCARRTGRAEQARAVNTLVRAADGWEGDNTDGAGLVRDLTERRRLDLRGRSVLMLGAGGAARGVAPALFDAGIRKLVVVNRTPARADALVDDLGEPDRAMSRYWEDLRNLGDFELLVNATSLGRDGGRFDLPSSLVNSLTMAVDINYGEAAIPFLAWARASGCRRAYDGLGMLVEQAALSFECWHGKHPATDHVFVALQARMPALATAD